MGCAERSERAKRLTEELSLILNWGFFFRDSMSDEDCEIQNRRKGQIVRELLDLQHSCCVEHRIKVTPCNLARFFGRCGSESNSETVEAKAGET